MLKKPGTEKMYYFSDKLQKQLARIPGYPLTVVEAPSGFGKTTAIREYLRENLPPEAREYWYTCLGESPAVAWKGICELLANANQEIAANLKSLELPTMDTLLYMMAILREFECERETYLVIDNYHLVDFDIHRELMSVFAMHTSPNLHIIFITQQLGLNQHFSIHDANIHTISAPAFFFDRQGTASLFRMEGIRLGESELESVFMSTDGWVSALRLQIINYEQTGSFNYSADVEQLVETAIWNRLAPKEKDFLLAVSVMESFTARQAAVMTGAEPLCVNIRELLRTNDFIRYFPEKGVYTIHSILLDYLRNRFYYHQPEEFQKRTLRLAGQACAGASQYCDAAKFFYTIRDFDAILSLPFTHAYLDRQKENHPPETTVRILAQCPDEIKCRYPQAMLLFGYCMLMHGQAEAYGDICRILERVIGQGDGSSPQALREIEGEYLLLRSFDAYNDLNRMREGQASAYKALGGPSKMLPLDFAFAFGATSLLSAHWRAPGTLDDTLRDMDEYMAQHARLTQGHGSGAESVLRAEAMLARGEDDEAEILCHKALYNARSHRQTGICMCAELLLARIAILRGDAQGYLNALENIGRCAQESDNLYILRMADICLSTLSLLLGSTDGVAGWIRDVTYMRQALYAPVVPLAQSIHSHALLTEKRHNELLGIAQSAMDMAAGMHYLMPQVHERIFLALAKRASGNAAGAREHLQKALMLALPDKVYLPFAGHAGMEELISDLMANSCALKNTGQRTGPPDAQALAPADMAEGLAAVRELCRRQKAGVAAVNKALLQTKSPLTPREREIARLARDRLSAREIAQRLYIAETTVRATLRSVYSKLGVHSKAELNQKEF